MKADWRDASLPLQDISKTISKIQQKCNKTYLKILCTHFQNSKYSEVNFLTSVFQTENSRKNLPKMKDFNKLQKLMKQKVNTNLIFTLPSKLLILIIDHAESCFFFPSLTHFFITATYQRFSTDPVQARKQSASAKTCFPFKIKDK